MSEQQGETVSKRPRLAIIGGGSSGLICLKNAKQKLPDWDIVCYEKSNHITGCWGNPYPGFVSTSTKYTTQFSCFPMYDASCHPDSGSSNNEFFLNDGYGKYLDRFADEFSLRQNIILQMTVKKVRRSQEGTSWALTVVSTATEDEQDTIELFDQVIVCTGLAAEPKSIDCEIECLSVATLNHPTGLSQINNRKIVVIGGGESAVDYANRLASPELNNQVFLSLKSGIRVSPRYHPIRGVPSDFLRNRLMLSIHKDIRNWIGQRFVEWRIRYQELFESLFPKMTQQKETGSEGHHKTKEEQTKIRKAWAYRLTKTAKDDLFNMFHNKSDNFLDAVAVGRISIIGAPVDSGHTSFYQYDSDELEDINPELIVPAVGYRSRLQELTEGAVLLSDLYLGCLSISFPGLYVVGFARPIIGNIPTISEMQSEYVCGLIAGHYPRPENIKALHETETSRRAIQYAKLNQEAVYPVEMFPYCDQLAKLMGTFPAIRNSGSLFKWWHMQLEPASTLHYFSNPFKDEATSKSAPIYMPMTLIFILLLLKPVSWIYTAIVFIGRWVSRLFRREVTVQVTQTVKRK